METIQVTFFPNKRIHFIVGILKDKDYLYMLRKLEEVASSFEFVDFQHERALSASILYKHCSHSDKVLTKDVGKIEFRRKFENSTLLLSLGHCILFQKLRDKNR